MRSATTILAFAPLLAAGATAQEATPVTEREAAVLLAEGDWEDRLKGVALALRLGPEAAPELRLAVIDAAWAEFRGETASPPESEAWFSYLNAVQGLRDSRAIPLLVAAMSHSTGSANALADFGAEAFLPVLEAASDPDENPSRVGMGLTTLRFMLGDGVLTAGQTDRVRAVVRVRLSGPQLPSVVDAAVRLALALGDPELRAAVERVAADRATAEALVSRYLPSGNPMRDESHAQFVNVVQKYARTFLDGGGADIGPFRRRGGARR